MVLYKCQIKISWRRCSLDSFSFTDGSNRTTYRILYEEVDEGQVDILKIISPASEGASIDEYRYPKAGTLFTFNGNNGLSMRSFTSLPLFHERLMTILFDCGRSEAPLMSLS